MADSRQSDIVDLGVGAPHTTAADRDLVLAGQVVKIWVAVEKLGEPHDEVGGVGDLVGVDAGNRTSRDVAGDVAAGAERRDADSGEAPHDVWEILDRDPVQLKILPNRDVGDAAAVRL